MTREHKPFSTPVSVGDGLKRSDSRGWMLLGLGALAALAILILVELLVERPGIVWPDTGAKPAPAGTADEPRSYEVAPPGAAPSER